LENQQKAAKQLSKERAYNLNEKNRLEWNAPSGTGFSVNARENGPREHGFDKWYRNFPVILVGMEKRGTRLTISI